MRTKCWHECGCFTDVLTEKNCDTYVCVYSGIFSVAALWEVVFILHIALESVEIVFGDSPKVFCKNMQGTIKDNYLGGSITFTVMACLLATLAY